MKHKEFEKIKEKKKNPQVLIFLIKSSTPNIKVIETTTILKASQVAVALEALSILYSFPSTKIVSPSNNI